ncbi:two-component system sensor histidine kinase [Nocardioides korecus]
MALQRAEDGRDQLDEVARWELLLDAVVTMGADLSLDGLLQRIVAAARTLAGARYAALGVLGPGPERRLRSFVHRGIDPERSASIGDLPAGHGLLGQIFERPEPLRLHDLGEHPASYGFPPHHPPMHSFLGVPVRTRDQVFGNLYLTEKVGGGDFTEQDERIVIALAAAAGVAVENATLYAAARRGQRWMEATAEITTLIAAAPTDADALQLVADRARDLAGAEVVWVVSGPDPASMQFRVVSGGTVDLVRLAELPLDRSVAREVVESGVPQVRERLQDDPRQQTALRQVPGWPDLTSAMLLPLSAATGWTGVLCLGWTDAQAGRAAELDPALPAGFAEQAALSIQLARSRAQAQQLAVLKDRDRIGRDLHDLVIQRLFAVGLSLQGAARLSESPALTRRVEQAVDDLDATIKDIRRTIFELGTAEEAADLQSVVTRLVERAAHSLGARPRLLLSGPIRTRVPPDLAAEVVAVLTEALSNLVRHARADRLEVSVSVEDGLVVEVVDNGVGLPEHVVESGLSNLRERALRHGGTLTLSVPPGGGTCLRWAVPLAPLRPGT